uniref:Uncharacterized protein n=1 Tax=Ficedula albicollis TaxID=59894 RepID=A0A803VXU2_FICAL
PRNVAEGPFELLFLSLEPRWLWSCPFWWPGCVKWLCLQRGAQGRGFPSAAGAFGVGFQRRHALLTPSLPWPPPSCCLSRQPGS